VSAVLEVAGLSVEIPTSRGPLQAVRGIDFSVNRGETFCIVGESGSGKSLTALALMGLLPKGARRRAARLRFGGTDLRTLSDRAMADLRGARMAMVFQDPMTALNPVYTVGNQLMETLLRHRRRIGRAAARDRVMALMDRVGIADAARRLGQYPHQLSGGLRQRIMIAMALLCEPDLLIADEPTTALDVTIQVQILHLLASLRRDFGMGLVLITHDLGVVARVADRVAVMYAGEFVETGSVRALFGNPAHPYTRGLLDCVPVPGRVAPGRPLGTIPGIVPNLIGGVAGCGFRNRCALADVGCEAGIPVHETAPGRMVRCLRVEEHA